MRAVGIGGLDVTLPLAQDFHPSVVSSSLLPPLSFPLSFLSLPQESADGGSIEITVATPRFLDTSAIDVDVHPTWVQVLIKGKNLLLHLDEPVVVATAKVQRIVGTGKLLLRLAKLAPPRRALAAAAEAEAAAAARAVGLQRKPGTAAKASGSDALVQPAPEGGQSSSDGSMSSGSSSSAAAAAASGAAAPASASSSALGLTETSTRVSRKLRDERAAQEAAQAQQRLERLQAEAEARTAAEEARRRAKAERDREVAGRAAELGVDLDDLPDLE